MAKRLFLILLSGIFGIVTNPDFLAVAETADGFSDLDQTYIVETVIEEPKEEVAEPEHTDIETTYATQTYVEYSQPAIDYYVAPAQDSIQIAGRSINIYVTNDTNTDAGGNVMRYINGSRYNGKFLYGHNSSSVFGNIVNLGVGDTFTVTLDGEQHTYQISRTVIFEKFFDEKRQR